jgi:3-methyladenine DNA glycosylase AlkD
MSVEQVKVERAILEFRRRFRSIGTAERARAEKAYMKSALEFHGVTVPDLRRACAEFCKAHPKMSLDELRALVDALYATDWFDLRSIGLLLLERRRALLSPRDLSWLVGFARKSHNWGHVDLLATKVIGHVVARMPKPAPTLEKWARDPDFWVRRTALLAQLDGLKSGGGDFALFTRLAAPMLVEKEFFIRKAIGWVLREVSKKRPELAYRFLVEHGSEASGLTMREGSKYLSRAKQVELRRRRGPRN